MEGPVTWTEVVLTLVAALVTLVAVVVGGISLYLAHVYRKYAHIPQPPRESFFTGHGRNISNKMDQGIFFGEILSQYVSELGHTFVIIMMGSPIVFTVDQEAVKEILVTIDLPKSKEIYKGVSSLFGQRFLGRGLLSESVKEKWATRRASVNPAFHRQQLRSLMEDFNQTGNDLMDKLADQADGQTIITMMESLNRITLDVIGKVAFSMDLNSLRDPTSPFPSAIFTILKGTSEVDKSLIWHKIPFLGMKFKTQVREALKLLRETGRRVIEQRELDEARGIPVPNDVISYVISARKQDPSLTLEELLDDFLTFFIAGQETTANALGFTIRELGRNPEILKKVQEEVDAVIGEKHDIQFEDINKLEYTSMVIKESLRLFPPVESLFREVMQDRNIGGYLIPKGTIVSVSTYVSSRLEEFTPDALTFEPERWQPKSDKKPPTYTYFPFALGSRNCIGMTFAQIEAKVILAKFIQRFSFKLDPTQSFGIVEYGTLRPKDGTRVILTHHDK